MTDSTPTVADGHVIGIFYTLKNDEGETLDSNSDDEHPLTYLHGAQNIVPGLESALSGKEPGDEVAVTVAPHDGYGERRPELVQAIPRNDLPSDTEPEPGMHVAGQGPDGTPVQGIIAAVDEGSVTIDFNHPLAGENLHFEVRIAEVRQATSEEREHGHPHGPDGHAH